jgi:hypothetical protein
MKSSITMTVGALALSSLSAVAGLAPTLGKSIAQPAINVPSVCDCFQAGTANLSFYAAGLISGSSSSSSHHGGSEFDGSIGGGIALDYFFTENVGVSGDATWLAEDSAVHLFSGSVILRAPIKSACLAPYIMAGGGFHTDGVSQGILHAGGGIDFRIANCWGIFADARYNWASETDDYSVVRGGLRMSF